MGQLRGSSRRERTGNWQLATGNRRSGFTLAELLVAMGMLVLIGLMMATIMKAALDSWGQAERQRKVYARARAVFDALADDLDAALTRDPAGTVPVARFLSAPGPKTGRQVLMLVRTFGTGTERPYTFRAGDGLDTTDLPALKPGAKPADDDEDADPYRGRIDEETWNGLDDDGDGHIDEDLMPLGGAAQVVYLHEGRTLKRAVRAPVRTTPAGVIFSDMFATAQPLADDVLYFELLFATPYTNTWDERAPKLPTRTYRGRQGYGPDRLWDSTRGMMPEFSFFAGAASEKDGEDDVFPERVRVKLVVEPHELRAVRTDTIEPVDEAAAKIPVASTRGFPPPGADNSYILVGDEWMHYKDTDARSFTVDQRGVRGTARAMHDAGSSVRCGFTFTRTFYLPGCRIEEPANLPVGGGKP